MKKSPSVFVAGELIPKISTRSFVTLPKVDVVRMLYVPAENPAFAEIAPVPTCRFVLCVTNERFEPCGI